MKCLRLFSRRHKDWFDENHAKIMDLRGKKWAPHLPHHHDPQYSTKKRSNCIRSTVKLQQHEIQDSYLNDRGDEIQGYFYNCQKEVYGPTCTGSSPLLNTDGTKLILGKNKIMERWAEHFDGVLNRPSSINDKAIERQSQVPVNEPLEVTLTLEEVR